MFLQTDHVPTLGERVRLALHSFRTFGRRFHDMSVKILQNSTLDRNDLKNIFCTFT